MELFEREINLIGKENFEKLQNSSVAVFGLGGVGSYVCEGLARAGVGRLIICDNDVIAPHNINRQLFALSSTVGKFKVDVAENRLKDINPDIDIIKHNLYFDKDSVERFDFRSFSYIADCIDSVTSKILLVERAKKTGVNIISSMGTGNKLNCDFIVADIYETSVCPLAKVMRKELRNRGISGLKVIYSKEEPIKPQNFSLIERKQIPASISFVPSSAGLKMVSEIVKDIINS